MIVNILGTEYEIKKNINPEDDIGLKTLAGYCNVLLKTIIIADLSKNNDYINYTEQEFNLLYKNTLRHEIIHSFIYESGLDTSSNDITGWARNEEMVDYFALQFPKILKAFQETECL